MKPPLASKTKCMLEFLREVGQLRARRVPSLDRWERVLWLHRIPLDGQEAHAPITHVEPEATEDPWLELRKCPVPVRPDVSPDLRPG